ncbi:unnamed protein product [Aureobasidium pullulans]|nr:unnamed protein product [Aureobasidium pullulans]
MILRPIQFRPVKGRPLPQLFFRNPLFQRSFHASPTRFDDGIPNHYATLGIDTTASAGDIKNSTGPAGGRPATGLSRRRTQFKGPPPSFYRSGGYGSFSQKRSDAASTGSHQYEAAGASTDSSSAQDAPGTGPSGFQAGFNNDVPHFDREGHFRTHDNVMKNRHRSRRRTGGVSTDDILNNTSMLFNFVLLSGVLTVIFGVSGMLFRKTDEKKKL